MKRLGSFALLMENCVGRAPVWGQLVELALVGLALGSLQHSLWPEGKCSASRDTFPKPYSTASAMRDEEDRSCKSSESLTPGTHKTHHMPLHKAGV